MIHPPTHPAPVAAEVNRENRLASTSGTAMGMSGAGIALMHATHKRPVPT